MENKDWYSSHGESIIMFEFIDLEVNNRGNYTNEDIDSWWEKYDFGIEDLVIWVTNLETCITKYCGLADPIKIEDIRHIIVESYDGNGGYLAIL